MNVKHTESRKFFVLEDLSLAYKALETIRAGTAPLEYAMNKALEELAKQCSGPVPASELAPPGSYGAFAYHCGANAWRGGELVNNHGEVYIEVWNLMEGTAEFCNNTAHGPAFSKNPGNNAISILVKL